jgi:hypothetical protein
LDVADLHEAVMDNATELRAVTSHGAAFQAVDMSHVHNTQDPVNAASSDGSVTLPDGLTRPAHWPIWVLPDCEEHSFDDELEKW